MMLKGAVLVLGVWCAALLYLMVVEVGCDLVPSPMSARLADS